jgi:hypothetical protein
MSLRPLDRYAAAARDSAEVWRTAAGLFIIVVAGLAIQQSLALLILAPVGADRAESMLDALAPGRASPGAALFGLYAAGVFLGGLALALQLLHGRRLRSVLGAEPRAALRQGLHVGAAAAGLLVALALLLPQEPAPVRNAALAAGRWAVLLPLALGGVLVTAVSEELVFRGYLLQQLAARFPGRPVWLGVPAALYALAHLAPEADPAAARAVAVWTFAFALACADLTARTGSPGAAIGLHAAVTGVALLLVGLEGPGGALALWHLPIAPGEARLAALLAPELATLLCLWLAARLTLRV